MLKFNPDLVFVEFAVNDAAASEEKIIRSTGGLSGKYPETEICFVYTIMESFLGAAQKGELPKSKQGEKALKIRKIIKNSAGISVKY